MLIPTPPMGWNTWNTFGNNISEALIKAAADRVNHCWGNPDCFTLVRLLEGGDLALGCFNLSENPCGNLLLLEQLGLTYESGLRLRLVDCFTGEEQHSGRDTVTVPRLPPHGCRVFRCTPVKA